MAFEVFDKRKTPLAKAPSVTIMKRGTISMTRAAHELLGNAETVELLFDRDRKIVGMKPAAADSPHAYVLRPQSPTKQTGPLLLSGTAFTQFYRIDTSASRRFTPHMEDDILCIDLNGPSVEIIGNRSAASSEDAASDEVDE